jgi:hypothetical protein
MSEVETPVVDNPTPAANWKDSVPSELRFNEGGVDALGKFETPDQVAKSYLELQKTMGNRVKLPTDETPDEERSAFYQRMGRPEKPDGYTLPQMEEGEAINPDIINPIMAVAHEAGINDKAFGALVNKYLAIEAQMQEAQQVAIEQATNAAEQQLQADWGGDYQANMETIERVFRQFSTDETRDVIKEKFNEAGLGRDPVILGWLKDIGVGMLNDRFVKGNAEQPKTDPDYKPQYPNSPEMYRTMEGPEGEKARQWFSQNKGFVW